MERQKIQIEETNVLIARRQPPGDRFRLVLDKPDGPIYKSLTDTLEAYMVRTDFRGEYRLAPLKGELYAITTEEVPVTIEQPKKYSMYGEYSENGE